MMTLKLNGLKQMNSNLPAGAEQDVNAPWNNVSDLCRNCDRDIIRGMSQEAAYDESDVDEYMEAMLEEADLCRDCFKEQEADDQDDWVNWDS
jgi:hypothetical protein